MEFVRETGNPNSVLINYANIALALSRRYVHEFLSLPVWGTLHRPVKVCLTSSIA